MVIRSAQIHDCHSDARMAFEGEEAFVMVVEVTLRLNSFVKSDPRSSTEMLLLGKRRERMADSLR